MLWKPQAQHGCRAGLSKLPTRPEPEQTRELDHPLDLGEGQKQQNQHPQETDLHTLSGLVHQSAPVPCWRNT